MAEKTIKLIYHKGDGVEIEEEVPVKEQSGSNGVINIPNDVYLLRLEGTESIGAEGVVLATFGNGIQFPSNTNIFDMGGKVSSLSDESEAIGDAADVVWNKVSGDTEPEIHLYEDDGSDSVKQIMAIEFGWEWFHPLGVFDGIADACFAINQNNPEIIWESVDEEDIAKTPSLVLTGGVRTPKAVGAGTYIDTSVHLYEVEKGIAYLINKGMS